ncbi:hypothetical protein ACOT81_38385 [Streptomyces sp. WI04-05B]|uniref:hypothetical protein n=1 Tax=Streptomyces TaxID=1883 RepID=UPI0029AE9571|nr:MULTISPECIES: hypothetical protein [unclassified Streptomyces]MDX2586491.1 hypothetical protein [Streptomyces sp. WI04-05A]
MSIPVDTLAMTGRDSVTDADATLEDWIRAINLAFDQAPPPPSSTQQRSATRTQQDQGAALS